MTVTPDENSPVMSVTECAAYLRIGRSHAYEMVKEGKIPSIRLGKKILIPRRRLEQLLGEPVVQANQTGTH